MRSMWTIYDSSWLLKFSPNVQRPWWIFGHDNIYVHCYIRRTSLFCGSFEEQPRKNIPKRFRLTLHFSACRILAWRTIPEVFINEVRWLLRSQHDSMSSTHQIKLLIYTVLRLLWNLNMAHSSIGYDARFSILKEQFDSAIGYDNILRWD